MTNFANLFSRVSKYIYYLFYLRLAYFWMPIKSTSLNYKTHLFKFFIIIAKVVPELKSDSIRYQLANLIFLIVYLSMNLVDI